MIKINIKEVQYGPLPGYAIKGIAKTESNERLFSVLIKRIVRRENISRLTLRNWKIDPVSNIPYLLVRYAKTEEELKILLQARETDRNNPSSETSLLKGGIS